VKRHHWISVSRNIEKLVVRSIERPTWRRLNEAFQAVGALSSDAAALQANREWATLKPLVYQLLTYVFTSDQIPEFLRALVQGRYDRPLNLMDQVEEAATVDRESNKATHQ